MADPRTSGARETSDDEPTVELVVEEFARRLRAGDRPSVTEYEVKYPDHADEIRDVLSAVQVMEDLKPRREDSRPAARPMVPIPDRIGEFRILREIGRGGMGVVYEAEQESLRRRVALKVLPAHLLAQDHLRARFLREAHAAARLHHTNIVPVFAVGEHDGMCFYVMQLIGGQSLDRLAADGSLPAADVARIGVQVADALAYAHSQGVLHRDIKPSNLIVDERGAAWVTDFGVAKLVEEANLTRSGDLVGTLRYMPPERFAGRTDARGDVYALGVTLYEVLAGRPPFPDTTPHHLIQLITNNNLPPLRTVAPHVHRDLETIVLKAAARDVSQRYPDAGALAEDLRRFLDDRPILARRAGPVERARRWCARNPLIAGSAAAVFLLLVAVAAVSVVGYAQTARARTETAEANERLEKALAAETRQRERAEAATALALRALNRLFDRFAPTRLVATPLATTADGVELPAQPLLPPEAVPLLEESLQTFEEIARASGEFVGLRRQAAEANQRIGDIRQRLGRFEAAAAAYRTAIDLYRERPADEVRIPLARSYNELGRALRALQRPADAGAAVEQAVQTLVAAPPEFAARPECRYELARAYYTLGQRDFLIGPGPRPKDWGPKGFGPPKKGGGPKGDGPPKFFKEHGPRPFGPPPFGPPPFGPPGDHPGEKAIALMKALRDEYPKVPEYRHLLACCYRDVPPAPFGPKDDRPRPELAIELLRELIRDFPKVPDYAFDLCETLRMGGPPGDLARDRLKEAIERSAELIAQYPNVPQYRAAHAQYLDRLGMILFETGDRAEAERTHRRAVVVQGALVKQDPAAVTHAIWLSLMECSLARTVADRGERPEARALYESATARLDRLRTADPATPAVRAVSSMAYREAARFYTQAGEPDRAAKAEAKANALGPPGPPVFGGPKRP
ncbi:MAG TPA: protein kinase [Gemmataceae bacterium]|nr:protein kinase [Gemmataceae bacterium]